MSDDPVQRLTLEFARLPGVGERSAGRLALHVIRQAQRDRAGESLAHDLAQALVAAVETTRLCTICHNLSVGPECVVCTDPRRDPVSLCVVEGVADLRAVEHSGAFSGTYHVLHGALSPLDGVGPEDLRLPELLGRVQRQGITEVILATNANAEGDATALYIARLLRGTSVRVTRLASGIPLGGEIEFIDQATLTRALKQRQVVG